MGRHSPQDTVTPPSGQPEFAAAQSYAALAGEARPGAELSSASDFMVMMTKQIEQWQAEYGKSPQQQELSKLVESRAQAVRDTQNLSAIVTEGNPQVTNRAAVEKAARIGIHDGLVKLNNYLDGTPQPKPVELYDAPGLKEPEIYTVITELEAILGAQLNDAVEVRVTRDETGQAWRTESTHATTAVPGLALRYEMSYLGAPEDQESGPQPRNQPPLHVRLYAEMVEDSKL